MKKIISYILLLAMCVSLFAGCSNKPAGTTAGTQSTAAPTEPTQPGVNKLENAKKFLFNMYKDDALVTRKDYPVISSLLIGEDEFTVTWSVNVDSIEIVAENNGYTVKLPTDNIAEIDYVLTGTVADANGNTVTVEFPHQVPVAKLTAAQIVDLAYSLASGEKLTGPFELTGTITSIDTAWSDEYGNITVTMVVGDMTDKPIMCYRLKGDGASTLTVGDKITVSGDFTNYNGTIEFAAGCQLLSVVKNMDQTALLEASYALQPGTSLPKKIALLGTIISIDDEYSAQYSNITVTIVCDGKTEYPIKCFRLKGDGAAELAVGQEIAVYGTMKNYQHSSGDCEVEFDAGCQLLTMAEFSELFNPVPPVSDPSENTDPEADTELTIKEALELGATKDSGNYTVGKYYVTGVITEIYNTTYGNMYITDAEGNVLTVYGTFNADGSARFDAMESQPQVGDTVKVYGIIGQYNDTPQMKNGWIVEMPEHTTDPVDPTEPSEPATEPTEPVEPTEPTEPTEPVEPAEKTVRLYFPGDGVYVTGTEYVYTSSSGSTKNELVLSSNAAEALVLTMKENGDTVSFVTADGKYLYADGTNVQLVDEAGEYTAFVLEATDGGYFIRCANAVYNGNAQYLEVYKGYLTVFRMDSSKANIYTFQLEEID